MPSTYFSRLRTAIQRSIVGQEVRFQDSFDVVIGQGKSLFGSSRLFRSFSSSTHTELHELLRPGTVFAARSELVSRKRNISVVGALSRTLSIPSVSGPSFQTCAYHIDCAITEPEHFKVSIKFQNKPMAACGSRAVFGECSLDNLASRHKRLPLSTDSASIIYSNRSFESCRKASMSLKKHEQPNNSVIYGYFMYNAAKRWCNSHPYIGSGPRDFHSTSSTCFSAGTASDVSFDNSAREEQLAFSTDSSEQYVR
jgi:protein phosphatase PTC7